MELSDALHQVASTYRLSIHTVDLQACQVLTLLEDAPGEVVDNLATHGPSIYLHTSEMPALFGLPMLGSPFFQNLSESDFNQMQAWNFDDYPHVESLNWASALTLGRLFEHGGDEGSPEGYDDTVYLEDIEFGPFSDVSSIRNRYSISNFLRALMKEKCLDLGSDEDSPPQDVALVLCEETNTPPEWVQTEKIFDTILSFVSFEDQVANVRLVCTSFKVAALRQLEGKLLDTEWLPIAFQRWDAASWFRVDARRGWSDGFANREDVIDSALWMVSCRCLGRCESKDSCPGTQAPPSFWVDDDVKVLDVAQARRLLSEQGQSISPPTFQMVKKDTLAVTTPSKSISYENKERASSRFVTASTMPLQRRWTGMMIYFKCQCQAACGGPLEFLVKK
jgi:hypothetical protein